MPIGILRFIEYLEFYNSRGETDFSVAGGRWGCAIKASLRPRIFASIEGWTTSVRRPCGKRNGCRGAPTRSSELGSLLRAMRLLRPEWIFGERAEFLLFGIEAPAAQNDAQTCHDGNGKVNAQDTGDFAAGHDTEDRGQRMKFHALTHDARRRNIILNQSPAA